MQVTKFSVVLILSVLFAATSAVQIKKELAQSQQGHSTANFANTVSVAYYDFWY